MGKKYSDLSSEERAVLEVEVSNGASIRFIARRLKHSASTLSHELGRQKGAAYVARRAGERYRLRRKSSVRRRRNVEGNGLFQSIRDDLVLYRWSSQKIAAKLRATHPDDPAHRASHETIYAPTLAVG